MRAAWVLLAFLAGCADNLTYPASQPVVPTAGLAHGLTCVPNLDGRIDAAEMRPALGVAARYRTYADRAIDQAGTVGQGGTRTWDWPWAADDGPLVTVEAAPFAQQWYAAEFAAPGEGAVQFTLPFDSDPSLDAVYRHDAKGIWLLGIASRQPDPPEGKTLLMYANPVLTLRFPLRPGDSWQSVGKIGNGALYGLPYAGQDSYSFAAIGIGKVLLPEFSVDQALRVVAQVSSQGLAGQQPPRLQVSFYSECLGELARATAAAGQTDANFNQAAQFRRLVW